MKVGITGHQSLENSGDWDWVRTELDRLLSGSPEPLIGITSLAIGADQMFAELTLRHNGCLEVVLPFPNYESKLQAHDRDRYQKLLEMASKVTVLQKKHSDEESYLEAGKRVVDLAELVLAVWDGKPAKGLGGTADIVKYAIHKRKEIIHLDPLKRLVTSSKQLSG